MANERKMYVRYLGNKVCWTILESGRFYMGECEELTPEEKQLCDAGGGELPVSTAIDTIAS